jgi:hypothetical protein
VNTDDIRDALIKQGRYVKIQARGERGGTNLVQKRAALSGRKR